VTVYLAGTTTLATIYADNSGTPKANPFTASTSDGLYFFYADNARYDVRLSGGGIPTPFTIGDILLADPSAFTATVATFKGRTGNVSPATDDYNFNQIAGTVNVGTQVGAGDKQGADSKLLTAGTVSGEGNPLCVSGNGGATTSGCNSALPTPTAQLQQLRVKPNTGNNTTLEFAAFTSLNSADFNFPAQSPGGSLIIGNNLITLSPVPVGVNWNDANHYLYVSGGTGTAEACLIVAAGPGTGTSGAASGTLTISCANTHSGAWTIQSATAGIQEAVNATPWEPGGEIRIPPSPVGDFWDVYAPITITNNYIQIVGSGKSSIIRFLPTTGTAFTFTAGGLLSFHGIRNQIRDLTIEGPGGAAIGIHIYGQSECAIKNVHINAFGTGIKIEGITSILWIDKVTVEQITPVTGVGILQLGGADVYITGTLTLGIDGTQPFAGIQIKKSSGTKIFGCSIFVAGYGLLVNPDSGEMVWALDSSFNWYDSSENDGLFVNPTGTGEVRQLVSVGDWFVSSAGNGVHFGTTGLTDGVSIANARIQNNGQYGIYYQGTTAANVEFRGNIVSGNSLSSSGTYHGFAAGAGAGGFIISGGTYGESSGLLNSQGYGIFIAGGSNYSITGVNFTANVTGPIVDHSVGGNRIFKDNLGVSNTVSTLVSAATVTISPDQLQESFYVTGTTTITTIAGGWVGRAITLIFTDAAPGGLATGGNIGRTQTAAQNQAIRLVFNGTNWY
jgi:hypothetical protein